MQRVIYLEEIEGKPFRALVKEGNTLVEYSLFMDSGEMAKKESARYPLPEKLDIPTPVVPVTIRIERGFEYERAELPEGCIAPEIIPEEKINFDIDAIEEGEDMVSMEIHIEDADEALLEALSQKIIEAFPDVECDIGEESVTADFLKDENGYFGEDEQFYALLEAFDEEHGVETTVDRWEG